MDQTSVADRSRNGPDTEPQLRTAPASPPGAGAEAAPTITLTADDLAAIEGLQALHASRQGRSVATVVEPGLPNTDEVTPPAADPAAARCPMPAALVGGATACPVGAGAPPQAVQHSKADLFVRRLLRVPEAPLDLTDSTTYRAFQRSMLISGIRCTLTYLVFPFVLPMLSFASGVGSVIGVLIGSIALVCDTFVIRRFFAVDHRYRWQFSAIVAAVMVLLTVLLVQDLAHIAQSLTS